MSEKQPDTYIPFEATASSIIASDKTHARFLIALFPEATKEQIACFALYLTGIMHDGILMGLDLSGCNPIGEIEAYQIGVKEGLNRKSES